MLSAQSKQEDLTYFVKTKKKEDAVKEESETEENNGRQIERQNKTRQQTRNININSITITISIKQYVILKSNLLPLI